MIEVLRDLVLISVDKTPSKVGSFFIPETVRKNQDTGFVRSYGDEVKNLAFNDKVLFNPFAGFKVFDEGRDEELLCIKLEDIIAKFEIEESDV